MKEIELKQNPTNLKVYYNDVPNLRLAPKDVLDILLVTLEEEISKLIKKKARKLNTQSEVQNSTKKAPP